MIDTPYKTSVKQIPMPAILNMGTYYNQCLGSHVVYSVAIFPSPNLHLSFIIQFRQIPKGSLHGRWASLLPEVCAVSDFLRLSEDVQQDETH